MNLYLKSLEYSAIISDVTLQNGWSPSIGDQTAMTKDGKEILQIEPGIWFKVYVFDGVSIDCTKRAIMWNSETFWGPSTHNKSNVAGSGQSCKRKQVSESMYIGGECYGYQSDLDELFDKTYKLLHDYGSGEITSKMWIEGLLKILHCYVLPTVRITIDDMPKLQQALSKQNEFVTILDKDIISKSDQIESVMDAMGRQRVSFISELKSSENVAQSYPLSFSKLLYKHIKTDISNAALHLDILQKAVEEAKGGKRNEEEVSIRREERDSYYNNHYIQLVSVRENLREIINQKEAIGKGSLKRMNSQKTVNPLHDIYIGLSEKIDDLLQDNLFLTEKKVLILSVKETIRSTIIELQSEGETCGVDVDKTGLVKPTDVLHHVEIPIEWLTLAERVASIFSDTNNKLTQKHKLFCERVIEWCHLALYEHRRFHDLNASNTNSLQKDSCAQEMGKKLDPMHQFDSSAYKPSQNDTIPSKQGSCFPMFACTNDNSYIPSDDESLDKLDDDSHRDPHVDSYIDQEDIVVVQSLKQEPLKRHLDILKKEVFKFFQKVCKKLQRKFGLTEQSYFRKIWLCYESIFYEKNWSHISQLYSEAYSTSADQIRVSLTSFTAKDLDVQGYLVPQMLLNNNDSTTMTNPSVSQETAVDLNSSDTSLENEQLDVNSQKALDQDSSLNYLHSDEGAISILRQRSCPDEQVTRRVINSINIYQPTSVTLLCDRKTWPIPYNRFFSLNECDEYGHDALEDLDATSNSNDSVLSVLASVENLSIEFKPDFKETFSVAVDCVTALIEAKSLLPKYQQLTRCLKELNIQITQIQKKLNLKTGGVCSDDLIDVLVVLLCNIDSSVTATLYQHLMLLTDFMPPFFEGGPYSFSLVQFQAAFQFLQDKWVMKKS